MGYTLTQINTILSKSDRAIHILGSVAYNKKFAELDETYWYDRDIIFLYKTAVEWGKVNDRVGDPRMDFIVERLEAMMEIYDYGSLTPIYSQIAQVTGINTVNFLTEETDPTVPEWVKQITESDIDNWDDSYGNKITSAAVTGTNTKTLTLNQQDGGTVTASWTDINTDAVSSVFGRTGAVVAQSGDYNTNQVTEGLNLYYTDGRVRNAISESIAGIDYNSTTGVFSTTAGYSIPTTSSQSNWDTAYANRITSLTTTGTSGAATLISNVLNIPNYSGALGGYVPYTGATTNVDLGEFGIRAGQFTLDVSPTGTAVVGTTRWNNTIGSSETTLKGGSVILKNGVDLVARIVNKVTPNATLTKANYPAVRVSGAQGQRLAVAYAQANNDSNSADTIGLVTETIATNQEGFIMTVGQLEGVNTTGSLQGETWADGDVLYLSTTTPGALTNIKPTGATGHIVVMGYVEYAHANNGSIYVKVMNGWELDELHNVYISSVANNQGLFYESATQLWKNKSIATVLGYTPISLASLSAGAGISYNNTTGVIASTITQYTDALARAAISLTTTGTSGAATYDNTTGVFNIPQYQSVLTNPITGTGTSGQVAYFNGTSSLTSESNLFWDSTNDRLGIGGTPGAFNLDVNGTARVRGALTLNVSGQSTLFSNNYAGASAAGQNIFIGGGGINATTGGTGAFKGSYNTSLGNNSLLNITQGYLNTAIGINTLSAITTDNDNTAIGASSLNVLTGGQFNNTAVGSTSLSNLTTGSNNIAIGWKAGFTITGGSTANAISNSSIFIGSDTKALASNQTNQIVIGHNTVGLGSNTTILGNSSTTFTSIPAGNLGLNTTTDAGFRLDVNGTARVQGNTTINGQLIVSAAQGLATITSTTGTNYTGVTSTNTGGTWYNVIDGATPVLGDVAYAQVNYYSGSNYQLWILAQKKLTIRTGGNAGSDFLFTTSNGFSSGTNNKIMYNFQPTYNMTGGTNTVTGIIYNPILTSMTGTSHIGLQTVTGDVLLCTTSGNVAIGTSTLGTATELTLGGSQTASSAIARGGLINTTLVAAANNDVLVGLDINPTFTNGAFTGVQNVALRVQGISIGLGGGAVSTNTRVGNTALNANTTGSENTAIGFLALASNTTGINNTAVGYNALGTITTASNNTAFGRDALGFTTTNNNTAFGRSCLSSQTSGSENTGLGYLAMTHNTTGSQNVVLGFQAGRFIADGSTSATVIGNSILIGYNTKVLANSQNNQIVIGHNETGLGNNTTIIGNSSTLTTAIRGNLLLGTTTDAGFRLDVNGTARVQDTLTLPKNISISGATAVPQIAGTLSYASSINGQLNGAISTQSIASLYVNVPTYTGTGNGLTAYSIFAGPSYFDRINVGLGSAGSNIINDSSTATLRLQGFNALTGASGVGNGSLIFTNRTSGTQLGIAATYGGGGSRLYIFNEYNDGPTSRILINIGGTNTACFFADGSLQIGNGETTIASAVLSATSTTRGFLPPRMTSAQRTAISSPATGLLVYQTDGTEGFYVYSGGSWKSLTMTTI